MPEVLNALSVDVEDYFHASALGIAPEDWGRQDQRARKNTEEIIEIFDAAGVKGTFFVLGWLAERQPEIVRAIVASGHEVACHGYSHELIYRQTRQQFATETDRAKRILEDASGAAVRGYRAASFSIVEESLWALDVIAELGFAYDSSIFPVRHDRYGMRSANTSPHILMTPQGNQIVEVPPSVVEIGPLRLPVAGGGYFRLYPYAVTRWAMRTLNRLDRPAIVYLHPWEIDDDQPRVKVGPLTRFRHYVNIRKVRARIVRLLADFRFEPIGSLAERTDPRIASLVNGCDRYHAAHTADVRQ